jgi:cleavage and polyadenylation specificity factor subunit 3
MKRGPQQVLDVAESSDKMLIMPIGAGNEVGRSCIILKFKGKTIMVILCPP